MTSELRVTTLSNATGDGPVTLTQQHAAKAHAHYNQSSNTVEGSFGISSVTDDATGQWDYNVTNNFDDAHYTVTGSSGAIRVIFHMRENSDGTGDINTTSVAKVENTYDNMVHIDMSATHGVLFGDLA